MACYQRHERVQDKLDLIELNKVLRAVGFAKFHGKMRETLPKPPVPAKVPKKVEEKSPQRGAPEPNSTMANLQATISRSNSSTNVTKDSASSQTFPPQPPTLHLHAESIQKAVNTSTRKNALPNLGANFSETGLNNLISAHKNVRKGDEDSFHINSTTEINVNILSAHRCYRILSYKDTPEGRIVFDVLTGTEYYCRSGPQKRRITSNVAVFATRHEAMSEKFPPQDGRLAMPRILVRFDAWGRCRKRYGGVSSSVYEYVKYLGIVKFLDAPSTISKKQVEHPIFPNHYPMADKPLALRRPVDRRIKVDKNFDIFPWNKGISMRN